MARTKKAPEGVDANLQADEGVTVPRIRLSDQGFIGLRMSNGRITEEVQAAFRYPAFIKTVNECRTNPTVAAAMNVYRMLLSRVTWRVESAVGASETEKERAAIVNSMLGDMEHSWGAFIESVIPYLEYGFAVNTINLRRRLPRNGSKFSDGAVGIRSLPTRNQDTIVGWRFDDKTENLLYVEQSLAYLENGYKFQDQANERGLIEINRDKFLLFTASKNKGNPQGNSIYKGIYLAHKRLELLIEQELLGIAKDVQGILKIEIPAKYLSLDASPDDQAVVAGFKSIIDNYNAGTQRGLLVPSAFDMEAKQPLFKYELLESKGSAKYDTEAVIKRLQSDILSALSCDILKLGSEGTGSFSLAESKSSVLALAIDYRLREIQSVLNTELLPKIYAANGWNAESLPSFEYESVEEPSLDEAGKFLQRVLSVSGLEVDRGVMNRIRELGGFKLLPDDMPVDYSKLSANLTGNSSKAGSGMAIGTTGNGTAKDPYGGGDSSTSNTENAE